MHFGVFHSDYEVNIVDKTHVIHDNLKSILTWFLGYLCFVLVFYSWVKTDCQGFHNAQQHMAYVQ